MVPTAFDEENNVLGPPPGVSEEEVVSLSVWQGPMIGEKGTATPVVVSCWKLTTQEMEEIVKTGRVWLVIYGLTMPPAAVAVSSPFKKA